MDYESIARRLDEMAEDVRNEHARYREAMAYRDGRAEGIELAAREVRDIAAKRTESKSITPSWWVLTTNGRRTASTDNPEIAASWRESITSNSTPECQFEVIALAPVQALEYQSVGQDRSPDEVHRLKTQLLKALSEIEDWKSATGLQDAHGDPDGITPEIAQKYWQGIEAQRDEALRATEHQSKGPSEIWVPVDQGGALEGTVFDREDWASSRAQTCSRVPGRAYAAVRYVRAGDTGPAPASECKSVAEYDAKILRKIEGMFEAVGPDLIEAVEALRNTECGSANAGEGES